MSREDRPNILLITTDSQRCDTLRCMGFPFARSPALDRLAGEGVLFEQAHTASPVCAPARCSLVTGLHTPIHGCIENGIERRAGLPVFPDALQAAGYHNIMVGKTHYGPLPRSFAVAHVLNGEKGADVDDFYAEHIRGHGYGRASGHPNAVPPALFMDAHLADVTIREIERARAAGRGPFFAWCSMPSPHSPIDPPGQWAHAYDGVGLPPLNTHAGEIARQPVHLRRLVGTLDPAATAAEPRLGGECPEFAGVAEAVGNTLDRAEPAVLDRYRRLYYGLAAWCDAQVGRLLAFLDAAGLRESTLVLFTSDHGLQLFDHGFNDKHCWYDETWRVPLLLSQPGMLPRGARAGFAVGTDITATILAAAGAEMPGVQGLDLYGPLSRREPSPRRCAVGTLYRSAALVTRRYKLEYYYDEGEGRLYDRAADPAEQCDVFGEPAHRATRDGLLAALLAWRGDIADVDQLSRATRGGGPVANRIARYTRAMRGCDPELRLNERVAAAEP